MRAVDANRWWVEPRHSSRSHRCPRRVEDVDGRPPDPARARATTYRRWPRGAAGQSRAGQEREEADAGVLQEPVGSTDLPNNGRLTLKRWSAIADGALQLEARSNSTSWNRSSNCVYRDAPPSVGIRRTGSPRAGSPTTSSSTCRRPAVGGRGEARSARATRRRLEPLTGLPTGHEVRPRARRTGHLGGLQQDLPDRAWGYRADPHDRTAQRNASGPEHHRPAPDRRPGSRLTGGGLEADSRRHIL